MVWKLLDALGAIVMALMTLAMIVALAWIALTPPL